MRDEVEYTSHTQGRGTHRSVHKAACATDVVCSATRLLEPIAEPNVLRSRACRGFIMSPTLAPDPSKARLSVLAVLAIDGDTAPDRLTAGASCSFEGPL